MPHMPVGALASSFTGLVEGLAADCERIANQRENDLRAENAQLMEQNQELRKRLGEALPASQLKQQPETPETSDRSPSKGGSEGANGAVEENSPSKVLAPAGPEEGVFKLFDSSFGTMSGDIRLPEDFWLSNPVRDLAGKVDLNDTDEHKAHHNHHHGRHRGQKFLLDPSKSIKLTWDVCGIPVLAWDLITIPMQVFDIGDSAMMDFMGWVTLIFWTVDMPITFITGIFDHQGSLVMDIKLIVRNYLTGNFFMDLIIIGADWIGVAIEIIGSDAPSFLSNLGVLRVLRISRFARLMRLRKLKAKWQALEDNIDNEWILVCFNLFAKICTMLGLNHYIGCLFYLIGDLQIQGYDSWLSATPYPMYGGKQSLADAPWGYKYLTALHWAITQFTPGSMHVQAQNIPERIFTIWCLVFGLVVFSSFLASVTQARMQLSKLMSKFERDLWLLRKYCRQNNVSRSLTVRMKRYVDLVLIPKFKHMTAKDVVILPMLSKDLQEELQTELVSSNLRLHPFFAELEAQSKCVWNKSAVTSLCNTAVGTVSAARCDILFCCGEVAKHMVVVLSGCFDYMPFVETKSMVQISGGGWLSEACLWTSWTRQGQLMAAAESSTMYFYADKVRGVIERNGLVQAFAKRYATAFIQGLNAAYVNEGMPTDMQEDITREIDMKRIAKDTVSPASTAVAPR